jgi:hypothetical protein
VSAPHEQRQQQHQRLRYRRPWFPPFAKDAKDGAPLSDEGTIEGKINVKGNGRECPFHAAKSKAVLQESVGPHPFGELRAGSFAKYGKGWATLFYFLCRKSKNAT